MPQVAYFHTLLEWERFAAEAAPQNAEGADAESVYWKTPLCGNVKQLIYKFSTGYGGPHLMPVGLNSRLEILVEARPTGAGGQCVASALSCRFNNHPVYLAVNFDYSSTTRKTHIGRKQYHDWLKLFESLCDNNLGRKYSGLSQVPTDSYQSSQKLI